MANTRAGANLGHVQFDVELLDGDVEDLLRRFDHTLQPLNLVEFLKSYAEPWFMGQTHKAFRTETSPDGKPWAPLKEFTVETREAAGFPGAHPINHRTGAMERYITTGSKTFMVGAGQATMRFPGRGGKLFNEKLKVAQQGANYPKTVARPVIGMNERDLAAILRFLSTWIAVEMTRGGSLGPL